MPDNPDPHNPGISAARPWCIFEHALPDHNLKRFQLIRYFGLNGEGVPIFRPASDLITEEEAEAACKSGKPLKIYLP
jgi:hypothetical protein